MENYIFYQVPAIYLAIPFFLLMIVFNWLGFTVKKNHIKKFPDTDRSGLGPTEASLLGLMALLLSFSFGMSASKFDTRRQVIVLEANDIGTAMLRTDLYPDSIRDQFRNDFKNYLDARIAYYNVGDDFKKIETELIKSDSISGRIWQRAAAFSHNPGALIPTAQMVPALNAMIDIVTTREAGRKNLVPRLILIILTLLTWMSSFLAGYGSKGDERSKVLVITFALMTTLALYLVIELDRPRQGLINLNSTEKLLIDMRVNMDK